MKEKLIGSNFVSVRIRFRIHRYVGDSTLLFNIQHFIPLYLLALLLIIVFFLFTVNKSLQMSVRENVCTLSLYMHSRRGILPPIF
jgi:hypothetical protein